ncbi:MAG: hypothetical protein R2754_00950 [Microthrixaceae bacterium]
MTVPFAWSADGFELLPFGSRQDEVIGAVSEALGIPPDEVEAVTMSECTPGTNARWQEPDVWLSFDTSGRFAAATFPAEAGTTADGAVKTLGDLQSAFPGLSVEYVPPNPDWGYYEASYNWSVDGTEASAAGTIERDGPDAPVGPVRLSSKRFDGVECFE